MGDRPIADAVEGLTEVRDSTVPQEIDGVLDLVRGDVENVRCLLERATGRAGDASTLDELDAVAAARPPVVHVSSTDPNDAELRTDPPPASVLVVDETTVYTTDEHSRVVRVDATLTAQQPGRRNKYAQRTLAGKLDGDDAGHLIAHMLGGIGDKLNLTPMARGLNRSKFATIEHTWREAVTAGKPVEVEIALHYPDEGPRSSAITVTYKIDGRRRRVKLPNTPPGGSP